MKKIILIVSLLICSNAWSEVKSLTCNNNTAYPVTIRETIYFHLDLTNLKVRFYIYDGRHKASDGRIYHITREEILDLKKSDFSFYWRYYFRENRGMKGYTLDRESLKLMGCHDDDCRSIIAREYDCKIIPYEELELRVKQIIEEDKIGIENIIKKREKERQERLKKRKL